MKIISVTSFNCPGILHIKDKYFVVSKGKWIEVSKNTKIFWEPEDISNLPNYSPTPSYEKPSEEFPVKSSKGDKFYTVKYDGAKWKCDCIANTAFRRTCRHITEIKNKRK